MKRRIVFSVLGFLVLMFSVTQAEYIPFKVKLNMVERLVAISLLPTETNYANWKIINDLKNQLSPTEEELVAINAKQASNGGTTTKWDAVPDKEIVFGEITEKMMMDALTRLDKESKLSPEHISLYQKFVLRNQSP